MEMMMEPLHLSPSEFVALLNQTLETAYPSVVVEGELANFRISKNRWVYFDIKDEEASVKFFGTVYNLPGPLEEGMKLKVTGTPRLHPLYGFSVTVQVISLSGEGTIKKAFELLFKKLETEGLFAAERKRELPYPPERIGLITSGESAAYADFVKIINARFGGIEISLADVQVQGDPAPGQVARAIEFFNTMGDPPQVLVITRGGGSADDLQAFNTEQVARAVAASRIPTLVAIGHEVDTSLAELAADMRASTPSNAAELLVPNKADILHNLALFKARAAQQLETRLRLARSDVTDDVQDIEQTLRRLFKGEYEHFEQVRTILDLINPTHVLKRGYAVVRLHGKTVRSTGNVLKGDEITIQFADGSINARTE
jgi:exodeoxyribonuclease VII large subunit